MLTVTKRFEFCYGHFLPGYNGNCRNQHGHNSVVEVEIQPCKTGVYNGMVIDFGDIKQIAGAIISFLDHKNLNDLPEFQKFCEEQAINPTTGLFLERTVPTAEMICEFLVYEISKELPGLVRLRVTETPNSWAEWKK